MSEDAQRGEAVEMPSLPTGELVADAFGLIYGSIDVVETLAERPSEMKAGGRELALVRTKLEEAAMWYGAFLGLNPDLQGEVKWNTDTGDAA